jgi:hypothetical protein
VPSKKNPKNRSKELAAYRVEFEFEDEKEANDFYDQIETAGVCGEPDNF